MIYDVVFQEITSKVKVSVEASSSIEAATIAFRGRDGGFRHVTVEQRHLTETFSCKDDNTVEEVVFLRHSRNILNYYQDGEYEGHVISSQVGRNKDKWLYGVNRQTYDRGLICQLREYEINFNAGRFKNFSKVGLPYAVFFEPSFSAIEEMIDYLGNTNIVWNVRFEALTAEFPIRRRLRFSFTNSTDAVNFKLRF